MVWGFASHWSQSLWSRLSCINLMGPLGLSKPLFYSFLTFHCWSPHKSSEKAACMYHSFVPSVQDLMSIWSFMMMIWSICIVQKGHHSDTFVPRHRLIWKICSKRDRSDCGYFSFFPFNLANVLRASLHLLFVANWSWHGTEISFNKLLNVYIFMYWFPWSFLWFHLQQGRLPHCHTLWWIQHWEYALI